MFGRVAGSIPVTLTKSVTGFGTTPVIPTCVGLIAPTPSDECATARLYDRQIQDKHDPEQASATRALRAHPRQNLHR